MQLLLEGLPSELENIYFTLIVVVALAFLALV